MSRWLYFLLIAAPAAIIAGAVFHAPPLVIFLLAALSIIPLAGLIGQATEALAEHLGASIGGLLNATFGNAAEIIIGLVALSKGLPEVVRASLSGSIIGNTLLVLGMSMLVGGWRHRRQRFDARVAGEYSVMLLLSVIGIAIPSLLATVGESTHPGVNVIRGNELHQVSIGIAVLLLICYGGYIAYSVFGLRAALPQTGTAPAHQNEQEQAALPASEPETLTHREVIQQNKNMAGLEARFEAWWKTRWFPITVLAVVTVITALMSEVLVGNIEPLTKEIGLNPFFVGLIIIPLIGNAAEHFSAITSAANNRMEIAMSITAGSSIQIALLAVPILVIAGMLIGVPLDLNFTLLEVAMFGLVAGLYSRISIDGESTWLEGLLLVAFYLILAVGTFFTPT